MGVVHIVVLDRLLRATTKNGRLFRKKVHHQTKSCLRLCCKGIEGQRSMSNNDVKSLSKRPETAHHHVQGRIHRVGEGGDPPRRLLTKQSRRQPAWVIKSTFDPPVAKPIKSGFYHPVSYSVLLFTHGLSGFSCGYFLSLIND